MLTRLLPSILIASAITAGTAWLGFAAACLWSADLPLCRHPAGGWIVMLLAVALVNLPVAALAREKARRVIGRGLYARPLDLARPLDATAKAIGALAHLAWEGELPTHRQGAAHDALRVFEGRGWWVKFDSGSDVWVGKQDLYDWLADAWLLQERYQRQRSGQSAIGQRRWEPEIGRPQWQARCWLLEQAGGVERNTSDRRSTPKLRWLPWDTVQRLEAVLPSEER